MNEYDQEKALAISQTISSIFDHADASLAECCSATALAMRVLLDNEQDKFLRAFMLVNIIKNLTMDPKKEKVIDLLRPNGNA